MMSDFLRAYPGYDVDKVKKTLTRQQFTALLEVYYNRPYDYACMVEPKK